MHCHPSRPLRSTLGSLGAALAAVLLVAACGVAPRSYAFRYEERRANLDGNGLRVLISPDTSTDMVEVAVRYQVGAAADPAGKAGLAHLVEHLMFAARPDGPGSAPLHHHINAAATWFNALTTWDATHYMMRGRREQLEAMLKVEAVRMFYGCKAVAAETLSRERQVVVNEIRQRDAGGAGDLASRLLAAIYPAGHPYRDPIGGTEASLGAIDMNDVCAFTERHYVPANATVVITGNVDPQRAMELVARWFGPIPRRPAPAPVEVPPIALEHRIIEHQAPIERPVVTVAWAAPPAGTRDGRVAHWALGAFIWRLSELAATWDFAADIEPAIWGGRHAPVFAVSVELAAGADVDEALDFIWKAADRASWPFRNADFEPTRRREKARLLQAIESPGRRAYELADIVQFRRDLDWADDPELLMMQMTEIDALEAEHVERVVERVLERDRALVVVTRAGGGAPATLALPTSVHEETPIAAEVDPAEAARPLLVPGAELPGARLVELDNGLRALLIPRDGLPVASVALAFEVGSADDPVGREGTAQVAAEQLWFRGLRPWGEAGLSYAVDVDRDRTVFQVAGISIYLEQMVRGLERLIGAGDYDHDEIRRWAERVGRHHGRASVKLDAAVRRAVAGVAWGEQHPYARARSAASVDGIGLDSVRSFRDDHYHARRATVVVVGSFDVDAAETLVRKYLGRLDAGSADVRTPAPPRPAGARLGVVDDSGLLAVSLWYHAAPDGDEPAARAARLVLAEMLAWRVGAVRHQLGASYGVHASYSDQRAGGVFQIAGQVEAARAGESLAAIRAGIAGLRSRDENFAVDFVRARRDVAMDLLGQSQVSWVIARRLVGAPSVGRGPGYQQALLAAVARVTPDDIAALAAEHLGEDREIVLVRGPESAVSAAFGAVGLDGVRWIQP